MKFQIVTYSLPEHVVVASGRTHEALCKPFSWTNSSTFRATGTSREDAINKLGVILQVELDSLPNDLEVTELELNPSEIFRKIEIGG